MIIEREQGGGCPFWIIKPYPYPVIPRQEVVEENVSKVSEPQHHNIITHYMQPPKFVFLYF